MYKKSPRVPPGLHSKMDAFLPVSSAFWAWQVQAWRQGSWSSGIAPILGRECLLFLLDDISGYALSYANAKGN